MGVNLVNREKFKDLVAQDGIFVADFYADWCISCKEMEVNTFANAQVSNELKQFVLLQADVTANSSDNQALLKRFGLFGPPGILIFNQNSQEQKDQRVIGYMPPLLTLSLFIAIVGTLSRMYRDSEMAVWMVSGVSLLQVVWAMARLCILVVLFTAALVLVTMHRTVSAVAVLERSVALGMTAALELAPDNIRVNCISPGLIKTDFARALWEDPAMLSRRTETTPLRRIGEPDEIAGAAVFLASSAGSFMTGQSLVIDGGVTI